MNKCKRLLCLLLTFAMVISLCAVGFTASAAGVEVAGVSAAPTAADDFTWDNATVYFLLTDRFNNGNTSNDNSYNRGLNQNGSKASYNNVAAFQGGDFKGITQKINEGYFDDLGINAIWVAGWFEQTHGYVVGGDGKSSFPHYSYHGYYGLDFTELDKNYGTEAEFKEMIDTAHEHGIRIVLDVVLNHPGYNSIYDMNEYNFGTLTGNWQSVYYNWNSINQTNYHGCIKYNDGQASDWANWWGRDWVRAGMAGYDNNGGGDLTGAVTYLPDFKTENTATVSLPKILQNKWTKEGTYNAKVQEIDQTFSKYNLGNKTVLNYLVSWYAKWVEEYGIDGFRCDTAKHVDTSCWKKLNDACTKALQNWRTANPNAVGADWDEDFWMTGENFGQGVANNHYYQNGFDSMINFSFSGDSQGNGCNGMKKVGNLNQTYADYANQINNNANFNVLTYISSHDTGLCRDDLYYQGSALLLLPGGVQIFYGDETNRQYVECTIHDHESRGFMNWNNTDKNILAHWQKVGSFRNDHVAVGAGSHKNLSATSGTAFSREYNKNNVKDTVVCVIGANKNASTTITLNGAFADGTKVVNAYTGDTATVTGGKVTFNSGAQGTILVEVDEATVVVPTTTPIQTTAPTEPQKPTTVTTAPTTPSEPVNPTTTISTEPSEEIPTTTAPDKITTAPTETTTAPVGPAEYVVLGDADFSGKVNIKDATLIQKHIAKIEILDDKAIFASDVDASEVLNIRDVTFIQKWLAKMSIDFAVGTEVLYKGSEESTTPNVKPSGSPIIIPGNPTTPTETTVVEPTETSTTVEPVVTEPQPIVTEPQPIVTEPQYTEPQYTEPDIPDNPVGDTITVYFENTYGWNSVYWHAWNDAGGTNTPWPGDPMTNVSGNIYSAEVSTEFTGIIFNDGSGSDFNKTTDTTIAGDGMMFSNGSWVAYDPNGGGNDNPNPPTPGTSTIYVRDSAGWGTVYCHSWSDSSGTIWPGTQMTNLGNGVYSIDIDSSHTGVVFNNGSGTQTGDLTPNFGQIFDNGTNSWSAYDGGNGGGNSGGDVVVSGDYVYFTDNAGWGTVYCHTWNTVGGTTTWPGVQMENTGGNQYRVMVDGSHTMVKFNNGNGVEGSEAELVLGNTYSN